MELFFLSAGVEMAASGLVLTPLNYIHRIYGKKISHSKITEETEILNARRTPVLSLWSPPWIHARLRHVPYLFPRAGKRRADPGR